MKCNVGGVDRTLRIIVGIGLLSLVFVGPQTAWGWIGALPLLTGLFGFCPAYVPFGIKTCKTK
jgi:Inner membrane protein YgaP-like, transmembrane domain